MKKVLIFSLQYHPFIGGAEVAIKEITDRIPADGFEFHMVTARFDSTLPKVERVGRVLVHRIGLAISKPTIADLGAYPLHLNKYLFQIFAYLKANELHKKYKYDMTWAMMAHATAIPAGLFKRAHPDVPYVLTLQEGDPLEHIERVMRPVWPLFRQGFVRADALQPISTFLGAWGMRMGFKKPYGIIPNGVDTARFAAVQSAEAIERMRTALGKKEGEIFLVTTSRLVHKNALDDVIRALPLLPESITFLIYGTGPEEQKLRALAETLEVSRRVRFMGQITHADMPVMFAACDIFIRPSRSEGMGNSFIEAMTAGLPVIATQEGGIADLLFDATRNPDKETTGWAVDANAPEQIVHAVTTILGDSETTKRVVQTARVYAQKGYDWNDIARRVEKLFSDTITSKS